MPGPLCPQCRGSGVPSANSPMFPVPGPPCPHYYDLVIVSASIPVSPVPQYQHSTVPKAKTLVSSVPTVQFPHCQWSRCPHFQHPTIPNTSTPLSPVPELLHPQSQNPPVPSVRTPSLAGLGDTWRLQPPPPCSHAPQFFLPHSRGSSHGQSRITRSAYPEEHYAHMMPHSFRLWQQLEDEAGILLYR